MAEMITGWNEHGHARPTGLPVDRYLGSGDLQDAENCGYAPVSVLAEMPIDLSRGDPRVQFRDGRITMMDGTVLERGGTLNCVWAVTEGPRITYVNLTPHAVVVMPESGDPITIPTSGTVARITETAHVGDGFTVVTLGEIFGLPEPAAGTVFVASMPLLMALAAKGDHRSDVVYPYGQIRDEAGRIVGCRCLARLEAGRG